MNNDNPVMAVSSAIKEQLTTSLPSTLSDPELKDLNRHQRRKYLAIQRREMKKLFKKMVAQGRSVHMEKRLVEIPAP